MKKGVQLIRQYKKKTTQLLHAAKKGDLRLVKDLLSEGVDISCHDRKLMTPLYYAARESHVQVVEFLLGCYPVDERSFALYCALISAASEARLGCVKELLAIGAPTDYKHEYYRFETPLMMAVKCSRVEIASCLIDYGADLEAEDEHGQTALFYSLDADPGMLNVLIQSGADLNKKNEDGYTLLHYAASENNLSFVSLVVEAGADINLLNNYASTPFSIALRWKNFTICDYLLKKMTRAARAENLRDELHAYCTHVDMAKVQYLIDRGADVNKPGKDGWTPLCLAVTSSGDEPCSRYLLESGADVHKAFSSSFCKGRLDYARSHLSGRMVALLKQYGLELPS